jgi:AcrR family transcriptional regulator
VTSLEKVKDAAVWVRRERNTLEAGQMRLAKMVRLAHSDGYNIAEIARAADLSRPTIYSILRSD